MPVHVVCFGRLRMEEVILRLWPPWADHRLRATPAQLCTVGLGVAARRSTRSIAGWSKLTLDDFEFVEQQINQLDHEIASGLQGNQRCGRETRGGPRARR